MKALLIASVLFFSLRAMSAEVGEDKKGECIHTDQSAKRVAKMILQAETVKTKDETVKSISK